MKLRITVEGKSYDVDVEVLDGSTGGVAGADSPPIAPAPPSAAPPPPRPVAPPPSAPPAPGSADSGEVRSPIAGTVTKLLVKVGDSVTTNEPLMIVEAMKMESNIASPIAGTVREIGVSAGETVQAGRVLARIA